MKIESIQFESTAKKLQWTGSLTSISVTRGSKTISMSIHFMFEKVADPESG